MEPLVVGMMADRTKKSRAELKTTVLYREGGQWHPEEVNRLVNGLMTEASQLPAKPEYVILFGHHTKDETLKALLGGVTYTATQVTGLDNPELPFRPQGWTA